ncbi:uncharacterized protein LOC135947273 [Cloeon dipterum]|uniref:uncharacterized protein LOC135947273 n=1 Tax=Cloeon dipterum TaxID=197152 RepID=UPI00321FF637
MKQLKMNIFFAIFVTLAHFVRPSDSQYWQRDLATDVELAEARLLDTRASTQEYLDIMNDIEDILWTKVQPGVSSIQENLPFIQISFADIQNIQTQINQASSVLVYQAKLQGKALVKHLRVLNETELTLTSESFDNLLNNRDGLVAQGNNVIEAHDNAMQLSNAEVIAFNGLLDSILEGQNGTAVDAIKISMNDINTELYTLGSDISWNADQVVETTQLLIEAIDLILGQLP